MENLIDMLHSEHDYDLILGKKNAGGQISV